MSKINKSLDYFVPVTYMPTPGILITKSLTTKMAELADNFFSYGSNTPRAFVTKVTDKTYDVKLITCKSPAWKTALKIALLFTPLSPLMLMLKFISRFHKVFEVTDDSALKTRKKIESIHFEYKAKDLSKSDAQYQEICKKAGIEFNKITPLQNHVLFFTDSAGNLTRRSFQKAFERLGSWKITSFIVSNAVFKGLAKHMKISSNAISISEIAKGTHSASTGVFNKDGTLDLDKFEALKKDYPSIDPNYLTSNDISLMRKANFQKDAAKKDAAEGASASKGEFLLALNLFSDCAVVDAFGNTSPAITLDRLKKLYTHGPQLFEEVAIN